MNRKMLCSLIAAAGVVLAVLLGLLLWEPVVDALPIDQSGWKEKNGIICYLDENGDPVTGLQQIEGKTYYFDLETGAMVTGWVEWTESRSYFGEDGVRRTGWVDIDGGRVYIAEDGCTVSGWLEQEEGVYLLNEMGVMLTGWQEMDGGIYYISAEGLRQTGWVDIEDIEFYFGEDGSLYSGWLGDVYVTENGTRALGWMTLEDGTYYFNEDGTAYTGWLEANDTSYYFLEDGVMATGWVEIDGYDYYLKEDGSIVQGRYLIDGETFYFTTTGANILLVNRWNVLPDDYEPEELVVSVDGARVTPECAAALEQMIADCKAAGYTPLVRSSYRTIADQQALLTAKQQDYSYEQAIQIVAIPGTSEHHTGLAVDIVDVNFTKLNHQQAERPTQQWLMEHCWEYGFIVRYPDDTTDYTGIIYEPWHYRYVGVELATQLHDLGISLEEYLDMLTGDGESCGGIDKE